MPRLVIESGKNAGRSVEVSKAAILGRAETAELRVADAKASREHCRVFLQAGAWVVVDLNSRNGIEVNGVKTTRKNLRDGDKISIGETIIGFRGTAVEVKPKAGGGAAGRVVQPTRPAAQPAASTARKPATGAAAKAKEAAFAAARADSRGARQTGTAAPAQGIEVRDDVLQFNKIDARKSSVFQIDLSQHAGFATLAIWVGGLAFVAVLVFLIVKLLGLGA